MLTPGVFIYHCAVGPVGVHVGNGMYGLMLVSKEFIVAITHLRNVMET
jgi:hypothetical protein